jgi:hypothetical protein
MGKTEAIVLAVLLTVVLAAGGLIIFFALRKKKRWISVQQNSRLLHMIDEVNKAYFPQPRYTSNFSKVFYFDKRKQAVNFNYSKGFDAAVGEVKDDLINSIYLRAKNALDYNDYCTCIESLCSLFYGDEEEAKKAGMPIQKFIQIEKRQRKMLTHLCYAPDVTFKIAVSYTSPQGRSTFRDSVTFSSDAIVVFLGEAGLYKRVDPNDKNPVFHLVQSWCQEELTQRSLPQGESVTNAAISPKSEIVVSKPLDEETAGAKEPSIEQPVDEIASGSPATSPGIEVKAEQTVEDSSPKPENKAKAFVEEDKAVSHNEEVLSEGEGHRVVLIHGQGADLIVGEPVLKKDENGGSDQSDSLNQTEATPNPLPVSKDTSAPIVAGQDSADPLGETSDVSASSQGMVSLAILEVARFAFKVMNEEGRQFISYKTFEKKAFKKFGDSEIAGCLMEAIYPGTKRSVIALKDVSLFLISQDTPNGSNTEARESPQSSEKSLKELKVQEKTTNTIAYATLVLKFFEADEVHYMSVERLRELTIQKLGDDKNVNLLLQAIYPGLDRILVSLDDVEKYVKSGGLKSYFDSETIFRNPDPVKRRVSDTGEVGSKPAEKSPVPKKVVSALPQKQVDENLAMANYAIERMKANNVRFARTSTVRSWSVMKFHSPDYADNLIADMFFGIHRDKVSLYNLRAYISEHSLTSDSGTKVDEAVASKELPAPVPDQPKSEKEPKDSLTIGRFFAYPFGDTSPVFVNSRDIKALRSLEDLMTRNGWTDMPYETVAQLKISKEYQNTTSSQHVLKIFNPTNGLVKLSTIRILLNAFQASNGTSMPSKPGVAVQWSPASSGKQPEMAVAKTEFLREIGFNIYSKNDFRKLMEDFHLPTDAVGFDCCLNLVNYHVIPDTSFAIPRQCRSIAAFFAAKIMREETYSYSNPYNLEECNAAIRFLKRNLKIIEIDNGVYLTRAGMAKFGLTDSTIGRFVSSVSSYGVTHHFFTTEMIRTTFVDLAVVKYCQTDDALLTQFLDRVPHASSTIMDDGKTLYSTLYGRDMRLRLIYETLGKTESMNLYDIGYAIKEKYKVEYNFDSMSKDLSGGLLGHYYFSPETEKLYQNKALFYKEIYSNGKA